MSGKRYRPLSNQQEDTIRLETKLPLERPVANYYRQSTEEQVGNISTTIQTVDMPNYLQRLGWKQEDILMIDVDEGVSGTTKIDEREGMRQLFELITSNRIGAVACQDEDRLFRDVTQIQVNIFIEACREHQVLVITPNMIYDFAHPNYGTFHMRQFRFKSEMAADFIKTIILGKLHAARDNLIMKGKWCNSPIPIGYIVDMRKTIANGIPNENYRKYVVFEPYAEVVREYFRMFLANSGQINKTIRQIWKSGPYFPDPNQCQLPEGHKAHWRIRQNEHGWCFAYPSSLAQMLSNATYIGHWMVKDTVMRWDNHPPLVDGATFFRAFNYLSSVNPDGSDNLNYSPRRPQARPRLEEERGVERPLCVGLLFAQYDNDWMSVGAHWDTEDKNYDYVHYRRGNIPVAIWRKKAEYVDQAISRLLLDKLKLTFDFDKWQKSLDVFAQEHEQQQHLQRKQLKHLKTVMQNLVSSLESITTPDLIAQIEKRYKDAQAEYQRLEAELQKKISPVDGIEKIKTFESYYAQVLDDWDNANTETKRQLIHMFVARIEITHGVNPELTFVIYWQDGSTDSMSIGRVGTTGNPWLPQENELLLKMVEEGVGQVAIAKEFPKRSWKSIFNKYKRLTGETLTRSVRCHPIKKHENYEDYLERIKFSGPPDVSSDVGL
ncbi:MAG: recombinase family protein [Anaerolineae bacterium]